MTAGNCKMTKECPLFIIPHVFLTSGLQTDKWYTSGPQPHCFPYCLAVLPCLLTSCHVKSRSRQGPHLFSGVLQERLLFHITQVMSMLTSILSKKLCCLCGFYSIANVVLWIALKTIYLLSDEIEPATILIAEGEYHESINVTRKGPLTLLVRNTRL